MKRQKYYVAAPVSGASCTAVMAVATKYMEESK